MTRIIKASEVRPRMEVEWTSVGVTRKCVAETVDSASPRYGVNLHTSEGGLVHIPGNAEVTVLAEPQPEEPTTFGARVVVGGRRFLRSPEGKYDDQPWLEENEGAWYEWAALCEMGPVTVIPDQGWTAPDDAPEVPERIEEWPEWDKHLRAYEWRDHDGRPWIYSRTHGRWYNFSRTAISKRVTDEPKFGPWTRATDA